MYNTASREVEDFAPLHPPLVGLYTCGMTVYYYAHVGHIRAYLNSDVLRRTKGSPPTPVAELAEHMGVGV